MQAVRLVVTVSGVGACAVCGYFAVKYALFEIQTCRLSSYMRWPKVVLPIYTVAQLSA